MSKSAVFLVAPMSLSLLFSCTGHRFAQISPGMSGAEVRATMKAEPSRVTRYEGNQATWYYGEDRCLLLKEDRVVEKQETQTKAAVYTPVGAVRVEDKAACMPEEQRRSTQVNTSVGGVDVR